MLQNIAEQTGTLVLLEFQYAHTVLFFLLSERNFLTFETVTVVPIQTKMIGKSRSEINLAFFYLLLSYEALISRRPARNTKENSRKYRDNSFAYIYRIVNEQSVV